MAQFTVKPINTETPIEAEDRYAQQLSDLNRDITGIRNQLGFKVAASANLRGRLSSISTRVADHRTGMRSMNTALQGAVNTYERTERKLLGRGAEDAADGMDDIGAAIPVAGAVTEEKGFDVASLLKDIFYDMIASPAATVGMCILDGIDGLDTLAEWAEFVSDGWDLSWAAAGDDLLKAADGSKTALGWFTTVGGIVLDAIGNGFENMEEYKSGEISLGRAIAETGTETAVGALIGAAIGSVVPGAGTVAGAIIGIAVTTAADTVCEWITDKDVAELVSDAILDAEEKRIDFLQGWLFG